MKEEFSGWEWDYITKWRRLIDFTFRGVPGVLIFISILAFGGDFAIKRQLIPLLLTFFLGIFGLLGCVFLSEYIIYKVEEKRKDKVLAERSMHFKTRSIVEPTILELNDVPYNTLVIGGSGKGRVRHPWSNLKPCVCGCKEKPLILSEKDESLCCDDPAYLVSVACCICGRYTEKTDIVAAIKKWNNDEVISL